MSSEHAAEDSVELPSDGPANVDAFLSRVGPPYPERVGTSILQLADAAVEAHPGSAALWIARGDLIQLASADAALAKRWPFEASGRCYERAVAAEPESADGHEELGIWLEIHCEDRWDEAITALDKAIALGCGPGAYVSRARILMEDGETAAARHLLENSPFAEAESVREALAEIQDDS